MKKLVSLLLATAVLVLCFAGCSASININTKDKSETYPLLRFTHYSQDGIAEEEDAIIIFEYANETFTTYQVAYPSCTCRNPENNVLSVMYIELLNTKEKAEDASIRAISFGDGKGLFGDNDNYSAFTLDKMDDTYYQKLVGKTMADFGDVNYTTRADGVDAISGATVTMSNTESCIKALFRYHADKYYSGK